MRLSRRMVLSMLAVVAISGGVSAVIGGRLLWRRFRQEAERHVGQDLNAAREFYRVQLDAMGAALRYTALGERFCQAVAAQDVNYVAARLDTVRHSAGLDILYVTDARGRVVHRAHQPQASGDSVADDRLVAAVLEGAGVTTGTILVPIAALQKEDPPLVERARIRILPTPKATPSDSKELDAGMMLCAAAPLHGTDGKLLGVLRAGTLLNRNYKLVDQVQNTVFHDERYRGKPLGTATVFQNDVRISTNVLRQDGSRAIGTRVSAEVYDRVLRGGRDWLGKAWVVNDWYVSAYSPIHDMDGKPIGMLYVGVLQRKFGDVAAGTLATFALVTLSGLLLAALVAWKLSDSISRPIRALARASEAISRGEFTETVPVRSAPQGIGERVLRTAEDEISALARIFNDMARSLQERDELLKERTRLQLTRSERLAAVGRLAAGVAHEINNPLTGVLTFSHMLLKEAPEKSQQKEDIEAIIEATTRCRDIIRGLLDFSRQNEPNKRLSNLNDVLQEALHLTRNQARLHQVTITEQRDLDLPALVIDPNQIQEVAVNVILNAIDAMPAGGTLNVRSRRVDDGGSPWAEFEISDTGCGIPEKDREHIFDPFFTTKPPGEGTGLGLAISYGIVTEHGGEIRVTSRIGQGTTVTVRLSAALKESVDDEDPTHTGRG